MFKQSLKLIHPSSLNVFSVCCRNEALCTVSTEKTKKWDLISAVCLERHPVITKPMTDLEKKVQELFNEIDLEKSYKSTYELQLEKEKSSKGVLNEDSDKIKMQTLQEFEDDCEKEFKAFQFSPRTTEADEKNITNSLNRKLDKTLLLLVEKKWQNHTVWIPPQGIRNDGETMRQAAERVLLDTCGSNLSYRIYGNAPIGYYKYSYPTAVRENAHGAKVFFYLAKYLNGNLPEKLKHQWLDRTELPAILESSLRRNLFKFLIPE